MVARIALSLVGLFAAIALMMSPHAIAAQAPQPSTATAITDAQWAGSMTWSDGASQDWTAEFRTNGVMAYHYANRDYVDANWVQRGQLLSIDVNAHYGVFVGLVSSPTHMDG